MGNETIIRADQRGLALGEAFSRRELLYFLVLRDIKIRYKQTTLGIVWAVLVPVVQLVVFTLIFGRVAGLRPDGDYPYPLFLLAGLVPWTFFAQAVTQGSQSLVNQQQMLTKVYFPRLFMPAAAVGGLNTAVADRVSGLLVAGHDPRDFATAIASVTNQPRLRREMSSGAHMHAASFGWAATTAGLLTSYSAALANRAANRQVAALLS
jgi:hypothetical protein